MNRRPAPPRPNVLLGWLLVLLSLAVMAATFCPAESAPRVLELIASGMTAVLFYLKLDQGQADLRKLLGPSRNGDEDS